ncbi:MAG: cache domain-containing protein [Pseudomonadota bacterium]
MNFKLKLLGAAVLPVLLISLAAMWMIENQTNTMAGEQIDRMGARLIEARRAEIRKMSELALSSIRGLYEDTTLPEHIAQQRAKAVLNDMTYGPDGYFFAYDQNGVNLVHPRLPHLVGRNLWDLRDPTGNYVIRSLTARAKEGGGFHNYVWHKPSTGERARKIGYSVWLDKWGWMIGTGLYVDDLEIEQAAMRAELSSSVEGTTRGLLVLSVVAVLLAALITWLIRLSEARFADRRLKELTHRIVEVQEDERKRVSTELHDGISQLLVSARYGLDQAMARVGRNSRAAPALRKSMATIDGAIGEVRRISMALRPSVLDHIGLAGALRSLGRDFGDQTGLQVKSVTEPVAPYVSSNAATALYRVAQEALTNVAKHADAQTVWLTLQRRLGQVELVVEDDGVLNLHGKGKPHFAPETSGMGLRNMQERVEAFQGSLAVLPSKKGGLRIVARVPVTRQEPSSERELPHAA